ncbi:MAG: hypothetical protein ACLR7Z_10955 [Bilophila wadsworthia]
MSRKSYRLCSTPTPRCGELARVWRKALTRYKVRMSQPVISAKVESNEKENGSPSISINTRQHPPLERIWKAWYAAAVTQLKDGSHTSLPEPWLEKLAHAQALGFDHQAAQAPVQAIEAPC